MGLVDSSYESLKPLAKIVSAALKEDVDKCRSFIAPDLNEDQFLLDYYGAAGVLGHVDEFQKPLQSLKYLTEFHPNEFHTLKRALARVAALKPHSVDVERLISTYIYARISHAK